MSKISQEIYRPETNQKEQILRSEAEQKVQEATDTFFRLLEMGGIMVEEGKTDAEGRVFTRERAKNERNKVERGYWNMIHDDFEIVDDPVA